MRRIAGLSAFWMGMIALIAMLGIDVLGIREVHTSWFASLAMILTAAMWIVPGLNIQRGRRSNG